MIKPLLAVALALSFAANAGAADTKFTDAWLGGATKCSLRRYQWPISLDDAPTPTFVATIHLVSDGKGKYTSGTSEDRIADDTNRPSGEDICHFRLVDGSYTINPDGTGTATTQWALAPGSAAHCANFLPGNLTGYINTGLETARRLPATVHFLIDGKRILWMSLNPGGPGIGVCVREDE